MYVEIMIPLDGFHAICYYTHITDCMEYNDTGAVCAVPVSKI